MHLPDELQNRIWPFVGPHPTAELLRQHLRAFPWCFHALAERPMRDRNVAYLFQTPDARDDLCLKCGLCPGGEGVDSSGALASRGLPGH